MQEGKGIILMWIKQIWMAFAALLAGSAVAAGTFAFIAVIGVVPRMVGKWKQSKRTIFFENAIILGGICGTILSVFEQLRVPFGSLLLAVAGLCIGIFVGCSAIALAEILNAFPILFRRLHLKEGLPWVILCVALGKLCGALYFFLGGMSVP